MKLTLLAMGTRGDVQPLVALGLGLQRRGYAVRVAVSQDYEPLVRSYQLEHYPVRGSLQEILTRFEKTSAARSGNILTMLPGLFKEASAMLDQLIEDSWQACQGSQAIIYNIGVLPAYYMAARLEIPSFMIGLQPNYPTREFASLLFNPEWKLPGTLNRLSYHVGNQILWQLLRRAANNWFTRSGLPALPLLGPFAQQKHQSQPTLYGFSSAMLKRPADWPENQHICGYFFLDSFLSDWQPSSALQDFLKAGPSPVYIGFGSMPNPNPQQTLEVLLSSLKQTGLRAILSQGWSGLGQADLPPNVLSVSDVPHDWLFPRVAAVVHHGGAGTKAAGLRAGVPSLIVPFIGSEQLFWGRRVAELGAGPPPIPRRHLTVQRFAPALNAVVTNPAYRAKALEISQQLKAESGVERAVDLINANLLRSVKN